jgi:hypothetical protein
MPLPQKRSGTFLEINNRHVTFSFWPTKKRVKLHTTVPLLFATDPWPIIEMHINRECHVASHAEARAFCRQAKDYFRAASVAGLTASKPVLLYYCFLNLVKSFVLMRGLQNTLADAYHGLVERKTEKGKELSGAFLLAIPTSKTSVNVFDEFLKSLGYAGVAPDTKYLLPLLLPQIVPGHRLWCSAADQSERFIALGKLELLKDSESIWINICVSRGDIERLRMTPKNFLSATGLNSTFRAVSVNPPTIICFEQINPIKYTHRPSDKLLALIATVKPYIWQVIRSMSPYRAYYLYAMPKSEHRLPQLASIYAIMFYLSSITRYRPHEFDRILEGEYGPFIQAFLNDQPMQFLFLMASEFAEQEVTKAALV